MDDPRVFITLPDFLPLLGGKEIFWYGVMFAGGFIGAVAHWAWLGRRTGRTPGFGSDCGLYMMLGSVIGARLGYVFANWSNFRHNLMDIVRVDQGGLIFYGGFLGGILTAILIARVNRHRTWDHQGVTRKETAWSVGDFITTALPLGHALGRFGCWKQGCCYGNDTTAWLGKFGSKFEAEALVAQCYPVQLFEVAGLLALYAFTTWYYLRHRVPGQVFAMYMTLYAVLRFGNEFFRGDERLGQAIGLNGAQWMSIAFFLSGLALWFWLGTRKRTTPAAT